MKKIIKTQILHSFVNFCCTFLQFYNENKFKFKYNLIEQIVKKMLTVVIVRFWDQ